MRTPLNVDKTLLVDTLMQRMPITLGVQQQTQHKKKQKRSSPTVQHSTNLLIGRIEI